MRNENPGRCGRCGEDVPVDGGYFTKIEVHLNKSGVPRAQRGDSFSRVILEHDACGAEHDGTNFSLVYNNPFHDARPVGGFSEEQKLLRAAVFKRGLGRHHE